MIKGSRCGRRSQSLPTDLQSGRLECLRYGNRCGGAQWEEALEMVRQHHPDLLVTDIRMPGCDGLEMIARAKQLSDTLNLSSSVGTAI